MLFVVFILKGFIYSWFVILYTTYCIDQNGTSLGNNNVVAEV